METVKNIVNEVLDDSGNIMTRNSMGPENNRNNITKSTKITDYNVMVGRQKNNNFLGLFGYHFYEGKNSDEKRLIDILAELEFEQYKGFLEFFTDNFSKENLKIWKSVANKDFSDLSKEESKSDYANASKVILALKDYVKSKKDKTITEDIVSNKSDNDIVDNFFDSIDKKQDKDILLKKIKERVDNLLNDSKI